MDTITWHLMRPFACSSFSAMLKSSLHTAGIMPRLAPPLFLAMIFFANHGRGAAVAPPLVIRVFYELLVCRYAR